MLEGRFAGVLLLFFRFCPMPSIILLAATACSFAPAASFSFRSFFVFVAVEGTLESYE